MTDVKDAAPFGSEPAQRLEQFAHRLWRQHRCRLVHDQQLRLLQKTAHDFYALPLAHRHAVDEALGIDGQTVAIRDFDDVGREFIPRDAMIECQRDVLRNGQRLEQQEVLEHHADAHAPRGRGIRDRPDPTLPANRAGVGFDDAVNHFHQRALARAVLTEHRVNFSRAHAEVDVVVGDHRGIALGDPGQHQARVPAPNIGRV